MGVHGLVFWVFVLYASWRGIDGEGLGFNWGTRSTHPLPADIVVRLLKDNRFNKVKLFEADPLALNALGNSGIEVMLGIPNEFLAPLASNVGVAEEWVMRNVSTYISKYGVDIRYVAVGNEPFLETYKGMFQQSTFPALQNIQAAIIKAGLGRQVKVTVPLNADVYQTENSLPSGGDFRPEIHDLMISIINFLVNNGAPLTINIYPFLSLYADPHFPIDYAFFSGTSSPVVDGSISYNNAFDANYDTLIWALEKNNFSSLPVIVGEVGWPTDGNANANLQYARKFNQGLINRIIQGQGTPKRPTTSLDIYLFGLIDEDAKSIDPGNFERHWGIFNYDGTIKYSLDLGNGRTLIPAKGVKYLERQWCVMSPEASTSDPNWAESINYACTYADCTSLGYGSSCNELDARSNASYAFNMFYQTTNQQKSMCEFSNLSVITRKDPSQESCRFEIMIDVSGHELSQSPPSQSSDSLALAGSTGNVAMAVLFLLIWSISGALQRH
ncbi:glucan endo-1,3-beta-glucosidase 5-like [Tasmannia lanceolata]|uniref:glucan endo-1,3-beta-glucosidase 5-like n=1 Tax=Tasmannia lanceolata TaxID=3420 RepID=UPI004063522A